MLQHVALLLVFLKLLLKLKFLNLKLNIGAMLKLR
jgi:hypothetical protein